MIRLIKQIWSICKNLVNFIVHSIESLFTLIANIPRFLTYLTGLLGEVPPIYLSFALVTLTISIVFLIIDRGK